MTNFFEARAAAAPTATTDAPLLAAAWLVSASVAPHALVNPMMRHWLSEVGLSTAAVPTEYAFTNLYLPLMHEFALADISTRVAASSGVCGQADGWTNAKLAHLIIVCVSYMTPRYHLQSHIVGLEECYSGAADIVASCVRDAIDRVAPTTPLSALAVDNASNALNSAVVIVRCLAHLCTFDDFYVVISQCRNIF